MKRTYLITICLAFTCMTPSFGDTISYSPFHPYEPVYPSNQLLLSLTDGNQKLLNPYQFVTEKRIFTNDEYISIEKLFKTQRRLSLSPELENLVLVELQDGVNLNRIIRRLSAHPNVNYAEPNYILTFAEIPDDPRYPDQWSLQPGGLPAVNAPMAWDLTTGDKNIVIANLDTGVNWNHEDLQNKMWVNSGEIPNNGQDDDGNGYTDDYYGWDFYDNDNEPLDTNGHGTGTSSVATAQGDNGIGIAGVCWQCRLMPIRIGASFAVFCSDLLKGIVYAVDNGARVMSMSLGTVGHSKAMQDAVDYAYANGAVMCVANTNSQFTTPFYPAAYQNTLGIAASNDQAEKAGFSSYGPHTTVIAPGVDIPDCTMSGGYGRGSGTSLATPHVAGAAGLLFSYDPLMTALQVRQLIKMMADDSFKNPGFDQESGYGLLNIGDAVDYSALDITIGDASIQEPTFYDFVDDQFTVSGTAGGTDFQAYSVDWGEGRVPTDWVQVASESTIVANDVLAKVNTSSATNTEITVRLRVWDIYGNASEDRTFVQRKAPQPTMNGWPLLADGSFRSKAAICDIDQDGAAEVFSGCADGKIYGWDNAGNALPGWPQQTENEDTIVASVAVGDLDGRPGQEIVIGALDGKLYAWHLNGNAMAGWPVDLNDDILASPVIEDIDLDGDREVIAATLGAKVYVLSHDGQIVTGWPQSTSYAVISSPAVGNVSGSDKLEIVVGCSKDSSGRAGNLYAWHDDGSLLPNFPISKSSSEPIGLAYFSKGVSGSVALADFDGDGYDDMCTPFNGGSLWVFKADGTSIMSQGNLLFYVFSSPAIGNFDDDPALEVGIGSTAFVYIIDDDGQNMRYWPKPIFEPTFSSPTIGDIDGDGKQDLLIGGGNGLVYAWNVGLGPVAVIFQHQTGNMVIPAPSIGDMDGDGDMEVVCGSNNGFMYAWDVNSTLTPAKPDWPSFHHDLRNTGRYSTDADAPMPPTDLRVVLTSHGAALVWTAVTDATGYRLYLDHNNAFTVSDVEVLHDVEVDLGSVTSVLLSDYMSGEGYYATVTAYDASGNESWYTKPIQVFPPSAKVGILAAGYMDTALTSQGGGTLSFLAIGSHSTDLNELNTAAFYYQGIPTGIEFDAPGGDGVFLFSLPIAPGAAPPVKAILECVITDSQGLESEVWPYIPMGP